MKSTMNERKYKDLSRREFTKAAAVYETDHAGVYKICKKDYPDVLAELEKEPFTDLLDCGCGTGILSIVALKMGAERAMAYDIDEWSVDNTRHNAVINRVDDRISIAHGDASILNKVEERFGIVMANINRNILLADMPQMRRVMSPGGVLLLSGFYTDDVSLLSERGAELGLEVATIDSDNGWAAMMLTAR